ncbi:MAG TPA: hypothetical protein DDZ51_10580 [Planctomycetaceae bacterium]|nr:hypothetical protein [Planctomycetaceae bacterium]
MFYKLLQWLARIRIPLTLAFAHRAEVSVGDASLLDAFGSTQWKDYRTAEKLFDVWSPLPGTTWEAFHCATLFASLDKISQSQIGPAPDEWFPQWLQSEIPVPKWLDEQTWLILDGPGWISVAIAAHLASLRVAQPVCTFDNWPHRLGLVQPEKTLAALIRYAPWLQYARNGWTNTMPPVWVCDNTRLGTRSGVPREFDNRYFLDDSILPGPELLKASGIEKIVYATSVAGAMQTADLTEYFKLMIQSGYPLFQISLEDLVQWQSEPVPFEPISRQPIKHRSFFRSSIGGFGANIPDPSSSSG